MPFYVDLCNAKLQHIIVMINKNTRSGLPLSSLHELHSFAMQGFVYQTRTSSGGYVSSTKELSPLRVLMSVEL